MFYSYDVLHPRKGKFAIVWLVATGHLSYGRRHDKNFREIMSVKITHTCEDIMKHVNHSEKGRKKFSLYLSTMLLYGTVKVFRRQMSFLLEEVMTIYKNLQRQSILLLDLDVSVPGQMKVTLREPLTLEDLELEDEYLLMPPPALDSLSLTTPRKRALTTPAKGKGRSSKEPSPARVETLRVEAVQEAEDLSILLKDWDDTPTRARIEDITLREDIPSLMATHTLGELNTGLQTLGPLDLGPPFYLLEDGPLATMPVQPDLEMVRKRLDLDERQERQKSKDRRPDEGPQQGPDETGVQMEKGAAATTVSLPVPAEVITPQEQSTVPVEPQQQPITEQNVEQAPIVEKIPDQQQITEQVTDQPPMTEQVAEQQQITEQDPEQLLQEEQTLIDKAVLEETPNQEPAARRAKRPEKVPPPVPEETPVAAHEPGERKSAEISQIRLSPVRLRSPHLGGPIRRRRKLIIDEDVQLSRTEIREQCLDRSSTLRNEVADEDVIDVRKLKLEKGKPLLSTTSHRRVLAAPLRELLERHYRSDSTLSHFDFTPTARRQLQLDEPRPAPEEISAIADASTLSTLESSRESARKSLLQISTGQLEASVLPSLFTELVPIQEEQAAVLLPPEVTETGLFDVVPSETPAVSEAPIVTAEKSEALPLTSLHVPSDTSPSITGLAVSSSPLRAALPKPRSKTPKREREIDEEISLASPKRPPVPRQTTFGLFESPSPHRRGPPSSPVGGFTRQTVEADIHFPPTEKPDRTADENMFPAPSESLMELLPADVTLPKVTPQSPSRESIPTTEVTPYSLAPPHPDTEEFQVPEIPSVEVSAPPQIPEELSEISLTKAGPHMDSQPFIPSFITPIKRVATHAKLVQTPESYHLSDLELQEAIKKAIMEEVSQRQLTFKDFLPPDATRKDAANVFSALLEMHKKRIINVSQQTNYGTIYVMKLCV